MHGIIGVPAVPISVYLSAPRRLSLSALGASRRGIGLALYAICVFPANVKHECRAQRHTGTTTSYSSFAIKSAWATCRIAFQDVGYTCFKALNFRTSTLPSDHSEFAMGEPALQFFFSMDILEPT